MRYKGKNAFVWTSNAYAHSTEESAGVEWEGGESRSRLAVNLQHVLEIGYLPLKQKGDVPEEG